MSKDFQKSKIQPETENFESITREFKALVKQSSRNNPAFNIKKTKNKKNEDYSKYVPTLKKIPKINSHFNFIQEAPVKMKIKKYNEDNQNKKFEFNTLKGYFKVFENEQSNFYKEDYMRKMFKLLNRKDHQYSEKRKLLKTDGFKPISNHLPPKIQPEYKTPKRNSRLESVKSFQLKNLISDTPLTFNNKHTRDIKLKETHDSEFSISEDSLNNSYKKELLYNLHTEYNFIDLSTKAKNIPTSPATAMKLTKPSIKLDPPFLNALPDHPRSTKNFFLKQFPGNKTKLKTINHQKIYISSSVIRNSLPKENQIKTKQMKQIDEERNAKIRSLLDSFKQVD